LEQVCTQPKINATGKNIKTIIGLVTTAGKNANHGLKTTTTVAGSEVKSTDLVIKKNLLDVMLQNNQLCLVCFRRCRTGTI
jgi:hypothetical protein